MKFLKIILVFVTCSYGSVVAGQPKFNGESLIGTWNIINERFENIGIVIQWEFTAKEIIVRNMMTGEEVSQSRYVIDTTKSPHWITVEIDDSASQNTGDRRLGIFRIQAGKLHLDQEISDGGERPDRFQGRFLRFVRAPQKKKAEQDEAAAHPKSK